MEQEKKIESYSVSYNDTGYKLEELERIFDKKIYQLIIKKKKTDWIKIYLYLLAALKCFKNSPKNCQESVQEIMYALEKIEKNWFLFPHFYKRQFLLLICYHVLKKCNIYLPTPMEYSSIEQGKFS
ncbi:hypothetical protein HYV11_01280 [Candidatus Dependentiae bacterium]|nr:hypothetical protein [Candidatus Dependentiae bacterium]